MKESEKRRRRSIEVQIWISCCYVCLPTTLKKLEAVQQQMHSFLKQVSFMQYPLISTTGLASRAWA
jgi:hypothetical protein